MLSQPEIFSLFGIVLGTAGFLILIGDFWQFVKPVVERYTNRVWKWYANNKLRPLGVLLVLSGVILQIIALVIN